MSVKYSNNFKSNLNSKRIASQIERNGFKSAEIIRDTSNTIAPIDSGKLRQSSRVDKSGNIFYISWNTEYAKLRYFMNKKNPQTTKWADKGYDKKKSVISDIMSEGVIE